MRWEACALGGLNALYSSVSDKGNQLLQTGALISELNELLADTDVDVNCHDSLVT